MFLTLYSKQIAMNFTFLSSPTMHKLNILLLLHHNIAWTITEEMQQVVSKLSQIAEATWKISTNYTFNKVNIKVVSFTLKYFTLL